MNNKIEIGDLVSVDGVEYYVKYPMDNGVFINEINELVIFKEDSEIIKKNEDWKQFSEFTEDEKKILVLFNGGAMKKDIENKFEDEIMAEYTFKKLFKEKFLMRLFPNKDKYISKIRDKEVLKLL